MNRIPPQDDSGSRIKRPMFAVLDLNHNVVEIDSIVLWGEFIEQIDKRIVAKTQISGLLVSTVFLGINHCWIPRGKALWFETMVFPDEDRAMPIEVEVLLTRWRENQQVRYETWREAEEGHNRMVQIIQEGLF